MGSLSIGLNKGFGGVQDDIYAINSALATIGDPTANMSDIAISGSISNSNANKLASSLSSDSAGSYKTSSQVNQEYSVNFTINANDPTLVAAVVESKLRRALT